MLKFFVKNTLGRQIVKLSPQSKIVNNMTTFTAIIDKIKKTCVNYNRLPNNGVGSAEDSKILQRFNENYTGTEIMNVNFTILPHFCHVVVDLDVGDALLVDINVSQVSNVADLVTMDLMMMEVTRICSKSKKWTLCQRLIIMIMIIIMNIIIIII